MTDKLANVKRFYFRAVLSGFGAREFVDVNDLPPDLQLLHTHITPALYRAICVDDPEWDVDAEMAAGHWLYGGAQESFSQATGTAAVRWFVELMECHKAFESLVGRKEPIYKRLYQSHGISGCFLDELVTALRADDPEWRP